MPTWPSSTKASTSNVDSGSDKPRLARADIKQNIDNTNAIIDTFDITSPADGNALIYNATSGKFETSGVGFKEAFLTLGDFNESSGSDAAANLVYPIDTEIDPYNLITLDSNNKRFTLVAGTYLFELYTNGPFILNDQSLTTLGLKGVDSTLIITHETLVKGLTSIGTFTLSGSAELFLSIGSVSFGGGGADGISINARIDGYAKFTKTG